MGQLLQVEKLNPEIYREDKIQFNLLTLAAKHETARIFTDQKHSIVCQTNGQTPVWIWSHPFITQSELADLKRCLTTNFTWRSYTTAIIKPELLPFMEEVMEGCLHAPCIKRTMLMAYEWLGASYPMEKRGHMEQANMSMMEQIAEFRARDINEMEHLGVCVSDLKREAGWMIRTGNAYLWKDTKNTMTSLAYVAHRLETQARINRVYTHPIHRKQGYASMLMHSLATRIYKEGRHAMVYADAQYQPANRTYIKSGFTQRGMLFEIGFK